MEGREKGKKGGKIPNFDKEKLALDLKNKFWLFQLSIYIYIFLWWDFGVKRESIW